MSADSDILGTPGAGRGSAQLVSGYLAAFAIFVGLIGIAWHPLRLEPPAMLLALIAAGMVGVGHRLQLAAVLITGGCFFFGMAVAVVTSHPLW